MTWTPNELEWPTCSQGWLNWGIRSWEVRSYMTRFRVTARPLEELILSNGRLTAVPDPVTGSVIAHIAMVHDVHRDRYLMPDPVVIVPSVHVLKREHIVGIADAVPFRRKMGILRVLGYIGRFYGMRYAASPYR